MVTPSATWCVPELNIAYPTSRISSDKKITIEAVLLISSNLAMLRRIIYAFEISTRLGSLCNRIDSVEKRNADLGHATGSNFPG